MSSCKIHNSIDPYIIRTLIMTEIKDKNTCKNYTVHSTHSIVYSTWRMHAMQYPTDRIFRQILILTCIRASGRPSSPSGRPLFAPIWSHTQHFRTAKIRFDRSNNSLFCLAKKKKKYALNLKRFRQTKIILLKLWIIFVFSEH